MGIWTELTIEGPSSAAEGERIDTRYRVKNKSQANFRILLVGTKDGEYIGLPGDPIYMPAGTEIVSGWGFFMPSHDVLMAGEVYVEGDPFTEPWILDATDTKSIISGPPPPPPPPPVGEAEFRDLTCSYRRV